MKLRCGHCKKEFTATPQQEKRARWKSTVRKHGFACSAHCLSMMGVVSRNKGRSLSPRKLTYSRVNNALETGKLVRPQVCSRCGQDPGLDRLGRSRIEAHHEDHLKPFEVVWLCDGCHKEISPKAIGERNGMARFTVLQVRMIRNILNKSSGVRGIAQKLANQYGVTHKTITDIRDHKTWSHVT